MSLPFRNSSRLGSIDWGADRTNTETGMNVDTGVERGLSIAPLRGCGYSLLMCGKDQISSGHGIGRSQEPQLT
jgi:hypothetical protein